MPYFKHYHLDEDNLKLPEKKPPQSTFEMLDKFDPMKSKTDHRILYEIIERRINEDD